MPTLLERLRAALAPEYEVERELDRGGMGMIFLGRDTALARPVAIKIIIPEMASANAAERFLREARTLANLAHANVVPIHYSGQRGGFSFYVMAYLEGETLEARVARGRMPPAEAARMCRDLLGALASAHGRGVVHRDINPSNILIVDGRAILIDFGIAKSLSDPTEGLTAPGQTVGTLEYMPPEQAVGGEITPRTDLYALAMVTYEAVTGHKWSSFDHPDAAEWSAMPRALARTLRKALSLHAAERWPDAGTFRRALWLPKSPIRLWPVAALLIVVGVAAGVSCERLGLCGARTRRHQPYELMVGRFQVVGVMDPGVGRHLGFLVSDLLERLPRIRLVPTSYALRRVEDSLAGRRLPPLSVVASTVGGAVTRHGDTLKVSLELLDSLGQRLQSGGATGRIGAEVELAEAIAAWLIERLRPDLAGEYVYDSTLRGRSVGALGEFLKGEDAFAQDAWSEAERHFRAALQLDASFARAAWRLANAQRWRRVPSAVNLRDVVRRNGRYLKRLDSLLIEAELAPTGPPRYGIYEHVLALYPNDPYARLLYGAELMHRGPLAGIPLDSGAAVLEEAVAQDPSLAPAHDQLVWSLIRLGREVNARSALDRLEQVRGPPSPGGDLDIGSMLEVAFTARFHPDQLAAMLGGVSSGAQQDLARTLRWALGFDAPETQLALGRRFATAPGERGLRASGHEAQALALVALGRPAQALGQFDSAAALFAGPTASLEALEWRVIPSALGVPGVPPQEVERARAALDRIAGSPPSTATARAAWALAVEAYARRDVPAARRWSVQLGGRAAGSGALQRLHELALAQGEAARGDVRAALARSEALLPYDESEQLGDPFARAVLHARRAEWLAALGRAAAAEREWRWYENSDFEGWLTGEVEAVEIDWALGPWARSHEGCDRLRRVLELWTGAEPAYEPLVAETRKRAEACKR
ncbi:MAG TPA: serine/threonine-protein kinase [Gemmatimonadales bacterium]|jgi:predicted Ser/Thr protein kinase